MGKKFIYFCVGLLVTCLFVPDFVKSGGFITKIEDWKKNHRKYTFSNENEPEKSNKSKKKIKNPPSKRTRHKNSNTLILPEIFNKKKNDNIEENSVYDEKKDLYYYSPDVLEERPQRKAETIVIKKEETCLFSLDLEEVPFYPLENLSARMKKRLKDEEQTEVIESTDPPWNAQGFLRWFENGRYIGTGTLIDKQYVLTAAHNIFTQENKTIADKVTFYLRNPEKDKPPFVMKASAVAIDQGYFEASSDIDLKNRDLAILKLENPLETYPFPIHEFKEENAKSEIKEVNVSGYPGKFPYQGRYLFSKKVKVAGIDNGRLSYKTSTFKGQSGGSVWVNGDKPYMIAIHTHGNEYSTATGSATFLNPENGKRIRKWIKLLENFPESDKN